VRPLPGAPELMDYLAQAAVPHAIATSGYKESAAPALPALLLSEILIPRQASSVASYAAGQLQSSPRSQPAVIVMRRRVCEENHGNARPLRETVAEKMVPLIYLSRNLARR
jgi:hypothetical protein